MLQRAGRAGSVGRRRRQRRGWRGWLGRTVVLRVVSGNTSGRRPEHDALCPRWRRQRRQRRQYSWWNGCAGGSPGRHRGLPRRWLTVHRPQRSMPLGPARLLPRDASPPDHGSGFWVLDRRRADSDNPSRVAAVEVDGGPEHRVIRRRDCDVSETIAIRVAWH